MHASSSAATSPRDNTSGSRCPRSSTASAVQFNACPLPTAAAFAHMPTAVHRDRKCSYIAQIQASDGTTLFINVQHPGETPSERSDPANPQRYSNWPDFRPDGRPRSATVAIRRRDGGLVGT